MTFLIYKASTEEMWTDGKEPEPKPCARAYMNDIWVKHQSTIRDEQGKLIRQEVLYLRHAWLVDLNTAEDFMALCEEIGDSLIVNKSSDDSFDEIMIYDTCIE